MAQKFGGDELAPRDVHRPAVEASSGAGQPSEPKDPVQRANWLPAPKGDFSLYVRAYWPKPPVTDGSWTPPAVTVSIS